MNETMKELKEFLPAAYKDRYCRIDDILGQNVVITDAEQHEGKLGEYILMQVLDENDTALTVMTGARAVMEAVLAAKEADALPVKARFVKRGRFITVA